MNNETVPFHIKMIAKLYPIMTYEDEESTGEIERFKFTEGCKNSIPVGKHVVGIRYINDIQYDFMWVSLGNDWFKCISKTKYYGIL